MFYPGKSVCQWPFPSRVHANNFYLSVWHFGVCEAPLCSTDAELVLLLECFFILQPGWRWRSVPSHSSQHVATADEVDRVQMAEAPTGLYLSQIAHLCNLFYRSLALLLISGRKREVIPTVKVHPAAKLWNITLAITQEYAVRMKWLSWCKVFYFLISYKCSVKFGCYVVGDGCSSVLLVRIAD